MRSSTSQSVCGIKKCGVLFCTSLFYSSFRILKVMIDRATIDKIMDATNIVDVVSEFVSLRKAGVNYKGLCPFHDDKTPSFMVSPSKQICHCFACGEGGNAINFLMKHEQITYPEALRWLAKKYNIEVEERELTAEEQKEQQILRREYIDSFKRNLRSQLNNISIQETDGSITDLGEKYGNKKRH